MKNIAIPLWLIVIVLGFYVMKVGQTVLLPFIMALIVWYLINLLATTCHCSLTFSNRSPPKTLCLGIAISIFFILILIFVRLISTNIIAIIDAAPIYQENFEHLMTKVLNIVDMKTANIINQIMEKINVGNAISSLVTSLSTLVSNASLILLYVTFLLIEQPYFLRKLKALAGANKTRQRRLFAVLADIDNNLQVYIGVKTLTSLLTSIISYLVMAAVEVDFADFWAIIIFLLNYIPNIGSVIGTLFPSLLALIQFDSLYPFLIVLFGLGSLQFSIGNFLEPRIMGNSLNISPTIIILSLVLWANIWGILGMFLCVPLMVIIMIVLAQFSPTRPIAIVLSEQGRLVK